MFSYLTGGSYGISSKKLASSSNSRFTTRFVALPKISAFCSKFFQITLSSKQGLRL
jgi:hypothetical protein